MHCDIWSSRAVHLSEKQPVLSFLTSHNNKWGFTKTLASNIDTNTFITFYMTLTERRIRWNNLLDQNSSLGKLVGGEWKQSNLGQGETELPSCHRTQIQSSRARGSLRMGPGEIRDPVYQQLVLWFLVLNTQEWKPDFSDPDQVSHWLKEVEPWWPARAFNRSSRYTDSLVLNFWEFLQALNTILQG